MLFFTILMFLLQIKAYSPSVCIDTQQLFSDGITAPHLEALRKEVAQNPRMANMPNIKAKIASQELLNQLSSFPFTGRTLDWANQLKNEILRASDPSLADYFSYAFRSVTLYSMKEFPRNVELDAKKFEPKDFESIESLLNKLETLDLRNIKTPIHLTYQTLRAMGQLPNGYLLLPTTRETPIAVLNRMLGSRIWLIGVITRSVIKHGYTMTPLTYFIHDVLHFQTFLRINPNVDHLALAKLREHYIITREDMSAKSQELFDYSFYFWWFENFRAPTSIQSFFDAKHPEQQDAYIQQVIQNLKRNVEAPTEYRAEDINIAAKTLQDYLVKRYF
jgi:hypothetical protein